MRGALSVAILPWNITISFLDPRGGEDRLENLIALCHEHHQLCAHGLDKHYWQQDFLAMMKLPEAKGFAQKHSKQLAKIYAHERR